MAMSAIRRALARAAADGYFREEVLEDVREAQRRYHLNQQDEYRLIQTVEEIEHRFQFDPLVDTEVDHGEQDAAGAKG
jgi:hypothetical protein